MMAVKTTKANDLILDGAKFLKEGSETGMKKYYYT